MDKDLIEDKLYKIIDKFNQRKTVIKKVLFNTLK